MIVIAGPQVCYSWAGLEPLDSGNNTLNRQAAMNSFLQDVERRALRMAELSVGNREDALELVQEAMLGLVRHYADRPGNEWKPLFYRILRSRINDFHRRRAVRQRFMALLPGVGQRRGAGKPGRGPPAGHRQSGYAGCYRRVARSPAAGFRTARLGGHVSTRDRDSDGVQRGQRQNTLQSGREGPPGRAGRADPSGRITVN